MSMSASDIVCGGHESNEEEDWAVMSLQGGCALIEATWEVGPLIAPAAALHRRRRRTHYWVAVGADP
jgi:hypothetical protein